LTRRDLSPVETRLITLYRAGVLGPRQFHIMVLRYEHALSLSQIALALNVSRGTVTGTLSRCHQKIRLHNILEEAA
jgi:RNA polymerase sigma factor (sigma-70 family)